jgi:hypothetical protein
VVTQFQVWLIYNGPTCCDLLFLHWRTDNGKFHFTIYSITLKLFDMQNKDQNTDFETRSLDTSCINESKLEQNGMLILNT